ncbi:MAG: SdiA-regulated domain-containing protein [Gemmatimonadota bacterium]|nr:SdiA-regulated domain-containing protein [Gemmatimonadota bacterium]
MNRFTILFITFYCISGPGCASVPPATDLILIRALPVEGARELSGLTRYNSTLYTVSDKQSDTIYRLELDDDIVTLVPHLVFEPPELPSGLGLDLEGITCDDAGNFYLISERSHRVVYVSANGDSVDWYTPSMKKAGELQGLFKTPNAHLEGITWIDEFRMLVAAERQPRGLIEIDRTTTPFTYHIYNYDRTSVPVPDGRTIDFTGLYAEGEDIYSLNRNAETITRISYGELELAEHEIWSFSSIVNKDEFRYENMEFGMGEGLCMDEESIYMILDNNGIARSKDASDRRPLLLIMERPE